MGYTLESSKVKESNSKAQALPVFIYTHDVFDKDGFNVGGTTSNPVFNYNYKGKVAIITTTSHKNNDDKVEIVVSLSRGGVITEALAKYIGFNSLSDAKSKGLKE